MSDGRRLKVALTYLDKGTSIGKCALEFAKVLVKYVDLTCYLTTSNKLNDEFQKLPCEVKIFPLKRGGKSLIIATLRGCENSGIADAIIKDNPDIVMDTGTLNWFRIVERMLKGKFPIAEIIHDSTPHPGFEYVLYSLQRKLHPAKTDAIISMSEFCCGEMRKKYPDKYHIVSKHGIIFPRSNIDPKDIAANRKHQLFFGRIEKYKGLSELLVSYEIAKKRMPELKLTVAGAGKISSADIARAEKLGVNMMNRFVTNEEVEELLSSHGVMLMPYTSATQSGVAAVAVANALPCVASDVGALPEQVVPDKMGLIVPKGDTVAFAEAMLRIAGDENLALELSQNTLEMGRKDYNWEDIGKQLAEDLRAFYIYMQNKK